MTTSYWRNIARKRIEDAHQSMPEDVSFNERKRIIRESYPWYERSGHPYRMWLKEQRAYLAKYDPKPAGPLDIPLSPIEKMIDRGKKRQ